MGVGSAIEEPHEERDRDDAGERQQVRDVERILRERAAARLGGGDVGGHGASTRADEDGPFPGEGDQPHADHWAPRRGASAQRDQTPRARR